MIEFDVATHTYFEVRDGHRREVPGVSHILDIMGQKGDFSRKDTQWHMTRGSFVHKAIALDSAGELDPATVDANVAPYLGAWRKFKRDYKVEVIATEKSVYCADLDYAGTLDAVVILGLAISRHPIVVDAKTGSAAAWHELQVAAYVRAHAGEYWRNFGGAVLYLRDTGYSFHFMEPLVLDRKVAEWESLVRQYHQQEAVLW
jgi:hypothetical protein